MQLVKWQGVEVIVVVVGCYEVFLCQFGVDSVIDYIIIVVEEMVCDLDLVIDVLGGLVSGCFLCIL